MSIRNIHHSNLPDKPVHKTDRTEGGAGKGVNKSSGPEKASGPAPDSVRISGKSFAHDMDFAKSVMARLDEKQIGTLQQIRKNISNGVYDKDDVQEKIGTRILQSQAGLESSMISVSESAEPAEKPSVTETHLRFLAEDEHVRDVIAEKILKDLKSI
ncbi:MAG: hypothetical protein WEA56_08955 [Balneolaceae bacterium]